MKILREGRKIYYGAPEEIGRARAEMMNALGRSLMEMLADLPEGRDARVSYMEVRNHKSETNPLATLYEIQLAVQEMPGRPENDEEPPVIGQIDAARRLYSKEPLGERIGGAVKLVLGRL